MKKLLQNSERSLRIFASSRGLGQPRIYPSSRCDRVKMDPDESTTTLFPGLATTQLPPEATKRNSFRPPPKVNQLVIRTPSAYEAADPTPTRSHQVKKNPSQPAARDLLGVPARRFVGELTAHSRLKLGSFAAKRPYQCLSIRGHELGAFQV